MSNFIYALTEEMKNKLINEGCKFLHNTKIDGKLVYVFVLDKNKLNFSQKDRGQYLISNRLTF